MTSDIITPPPHPNPCSRSGIAAGQDRSGRDQEEEMKCRPQQRRLSHNNSINQDSATQYCFLWRTSMEYM
ncbi:unnamed protein product [Boreogadus saida]